MFANNRFFFLFYEKMYIWQNIAIVLIRHMTQYICVSLVWYTDLALFCCCFYFLFRVVLKEPGISWFLAPAWMIIVHHILSVKSDINWAFYLCDIYCSLSFNEETSFFLLFISFFFFFFFCACLHHLISLFCSFFYFSNWWQKVFSHFNNTRKTELCLLVEKPLNWLVILVKMESRRSKKKRRQFNGKTQR